MNICYLMGIESGFLASGNKFALAVRPGPA